MKKSLTKAEILRDRRDIARLFRDTAVYRIKGLHLRVRPNEEHHACRALFATTRAFRTAVERNRSRRLVREAYRLIKHRITAACDLAFVMYPGSYSFQQRADQVHAVLRRADLIDRQ